MPRLACSKSIFHITEILSLLSISQDCPSPDSLLHAKSQKKLILTGASRFNAKPKTGLAFLEENGLIYADLSDEVDKPLSLARFLKSCTRLDKRLLGDFISKPDNIEILKAFIGLFDFKDASHYQFDFDHFLTIFLETYCRRNARTIGSFPSSWRSSADCANHRNLCFDIFCCWTRFV